MLSSAFSKSAPPVVSAYISAAAPPAPASAAPPVAPPAASKGAAADSSRARKRARSVAAKDNDGDIPARRSKTHASSAADVAAAAEALSRTVFVGSVPVSTTKDSLRAFFGGAGAGVVSVRYRNVPIEKVAVAPGSSFRQMIKAAVTTGGVREGATMSAFVVFNTPESAAAAISRNGAELDGVRVRVDMAAPPSSSRDAGGVSSAASGAVRYDHKRTVFIGNLPLDVTDAAVRRVFAGALAGAGGDDAIEGVRVVRARDTQLGKGIGFIFFKERASVLAALSLDGVPTPALGNRRLRVSRCTPDGRPPPQTHERVAAAPRPPHIATAAGTGSGRDDRDRGREREAPRPSHAAPPPPAKRSASYARAPHMGARGEEHAVTRAPKALPKRGALVIARPGADRRKALKNTSRAADTAARAAKPQKPADRLASMAAKKRDTD